VLLMTRTIKNTFAPVNRIPTDVFSLIPEYCDSDKDLIKLTHVCHSWREIFISRASLWTSLDCVGPQKTSVYLERSRTSPLKIRLRGWDHSLFHNAAFFLTLPHLGRLKTLTINGISRSTLGPIEYLGSRAPLLKKLEIHFHDLPIRLTATSLFDGNLSSLRKLRLSGVLTNLPWQNLSNLTVFSFCSVPSNTLSITHLLDFFEGASFLREIKLEDSLPDSSNAPVGRVVYLPHLRFLRIAAQPGHSILLNHLHIPTGTLMILGFRFGDEFSPTPDYFPTPINNLSNISHMTSINLFFGAEMGMRLKGPSGVLYAFGTRNGVGSIPRNLGDRTLRSLNRLPISTIERLSITGCSFLLRGKSEESGTYQTLLLMNNLRTLTLIDCRNLSFILALNPDHNTQNTMVCPELEELVLHPNVERNKYWIDGLVEMAGARASNGAKLSTIVIVCPREAILAEKMFALKSHVSHVEYRLDPELTRWDAIPGEVNEIDDFEDLAW